MTASEAVVWHDLECGGYRADLPLWRELAEREAGPVLDLGAGTGRVALDLAARGHEVVALDLHAELLAALRERGRGLPVVAVVGDARDFALERRFGLVLAPMQTVQLLGGPEGRAGLLRAVRAHLSRGGLFAAALTGELQPFEPGLPLPAPDVAVRDGRTWRSQPVGLRAEEAGVVLERIRETIGPGGERSATGDTVVLDRVTPDELEAEAQAAGLRTGERREIEPTEDHVGSVVVMLRG